MPVCHKTPVCKAPVSKSGDSQKTNQSTRLGTPTLKVAVNPNRKPYKREFDNKAFQVKRQKKIDVRKVEELRKITLFLHFPEYDRHSCECGARFWNDSQRDLHIYLLDKPEVHWPLVSVAVANAQEHNGTV